MLMTIIITPPVNIFFWQLSQYLFKFPFIYPDKEADNVKL